MEGSPMLNEKIGEVLKYYRKLNKWSVADVTVKLKEEFNLEVAEKTIYGWESNQCHPTSDTFLSLCELYRIHNLQDTFFSDQKKKDFKISSDEVQLIKYYRANPSLQEAIQRMLNMPVNSKETNDEIPEDE